ncbi:hypothetical protein yfred0001_29730 [Yersinia frederiksenii ATCC 33641]|nr:hypothetical protein yfred0001_29730 [Yersinia frederiksenii ATCC 33641]
MTIITNINGFFICLVTVIIDFNVTKQLITPIKTSDEF